MTSVYPDFRSIDPHQAPPFSFASAEPTRAYEPDAPTHVLLKQGSLEPGEFERPEAEAIEVMGMWGSTILFARHLPPTEGFVIGEGSPNEPVDFEVSAQELGVISARLVEVRGGTVHVLMPQGAKASLKQRADHGFVASSAASLALLAGTVVELQFGSLKFRIANVPAAKSTPRAGLQSAERSVLAAFGVSFTVAAALLAGFAFWMPAMGLNDGDDIDADRLYMMKQYLSTNAERNRDEEAEKNEAGLKNAYPGAPAEAAAGREGALGKLNAPVTNRRATVRGDSPTTELSRAQMIDAARSFGMIDLLGSLSSSAGGTSSPFARNEALGHDASDAEGNMFGDEIGESGGNGLRLSGLDNGGGGHALGVALGGVGTCGTGNCGPSGIGNSVGRLGREHKTSAPDHVSRSLDRLRSSATRGRATHRAPKLRPFPHVLRKRAALQSDPNGSRHRALRDRSRRQCLQRAKWRQRHTGFGRGLVCRASVLRIVVPSPGQWHCKRQLSNHVQPRLRRSCRSWLRYRACQARRVEC